MSPHVLLVNPNRIRPPVAPIAIDLLGTALEDAGFEVRVLDLAWSDDVEADMRASLSEMPLLVGLTFRNLDDCSCASGTSFVDEYRNVVRLIRASTDAPIVVGGAGLSIAPAPVLRLLGADYAIAGEGDTSMVALARALDRGGELDDVGGLVRIVGGEARVNARACMDLARMRAPRRTFVDNARYLAEGAQVGFETNRGCDAPCSYCADPLLSGCSIRVRDGDSVADELASLVDMGVDVFHTCDGEFNADEPSAIRICEAIAARGLRDEICWYAYCRPDRFSRELARAMAGAGCVGINFGIDHTEDSMLGVLGRPHSFADIASARTACRDCGIAVMFDTILGAPGETRETISAALDRLRALDPDAVGIAFGLRLYRGTPLADSLAPIEGPPAPGVTGATRDLVEPAFFVEPGLGDDVGSWLASQVAGDARFFYLGAPDSDVEIDSYNYNANAPLERAIAGGERGAYWDILRKLRA